jgi:hypothetical protein
MLGGREINPNIKGSVTPLQSLIGGEDDPNNETNYSDANSEDEHDYLGCFEGAQTMLDGNDQSQDAQQLSQPLGIEGQQSKQPVLTRQAVMDLVSKDAGTLTPGSGWELTKQGRVNSQCGN